MVTLIDVHSLRRDRILPIHLRVLLEQRPLNSFKTLLQMDIIESPSSAHIL